MAQFKCCMFFNQGDIVRGRTLPLSQRKLLKENGVKMACFRQMIKN